MSSPAPLTAPDAPLAAPDIATRSEPMLEEFEKEALEPCPATRTTVKNAPECIPWGTPYQMA